VDPSPEATGKCLTALSGSGQLGPDETTWLIDIHRLALAGQDYSHGKAKVFGSKYGLGKKKGPKPWKDQRRQEFQVDGGGRWPGSPYRCWS